VASDFEAFCAKLASPITKMGGVSVRVAQEFAKHEQLLGNSPKTFNNRMDVLRAIFQSLGSRAGLAMNPFDGKSIPRMDTKASTISHRPYTLEEIERIMHTLADEDFIRPIVITALCTAMRRINCCLLRYEDVIWSEKEKRIKVLPAKGGDRVSIPIFPLLERELAPAMKRHEGKKEDFVFPGQAAMYKSNPDGITLRVKKALKKAGFAETEDENGDASKALTVRRQVGRRRASIRGTHSCRTTWITLAFSGGMSVEEIQVITGQKSAEVIVGAYNRPGDELIRKTLEQSLPKALTGCMNTEVVIDNTARVTGLLSAMTDGNWQNLRDEALRLLNNNNL
jgi:integrase